mgnify:CR=1 FL=1
MDKIRFISMQQYKPKEDENTMNKNECINCKYYDKCGRPSRPIKCMGYKEGDNRDETTRETGRHVSSTDS